MNHIRELLIENICNIVHRDVAIEHYFAIELEAEHPVAVRLRCLSCFRICVIIHLALLKELVELEKVLVLRNNRICRHSLILRIIVQTHSRHNITKHCEFQVLRHLTSLLLALTELRLQINRQ